MITLTILVISKIFKFDFEINDLLIFFSHLNQVETQFDIWIFFFHMDIHVFLSNFYKPGCQNKFVYLLYFGLDIISVRIPCLFLVLLNIKSPFDKVPHYYHTIDSIQECLYIEHIIPFKLLNLISKLISNIFSNKLMIFWFFFHI